MNVCLNIVCLYLFPQTKHEFQNTLNIVTSSCCATGLVSVEVFLLCWSFFPLSRFVAGGQGAHSDGEVCAPVGKSEPRIRRNQNTGLPARQRDLVSQHAYLQPVLYFKTVYNCVWSRGTDGCLSLSLPFSFFVCVHGLTCSQGSYVFMNLYAFISTLLLFSESWFSCYTSDLVPLELLYN